MSFVGLSFEILFVYYFMFSVLSTFSLMLFSDPMGLWFSLVLLLCSVVLMMTTQVFWSYVFISEFGSLFLVGGIYLQSEFLLVLGVLLELGVGFVAVLVVVPFVEGGLSFSVVYYLSVYKVGQVSVFIGSVSFRWSFLLLILLSVQGLVSLIIGSPLMLCVLMSHSTYFLLSLVGIVSFEASLLFLLSYSVSSLLLMWGLDTTQGGLSLLLSLLLWSPLQVGLVVKLYLVSVSVGAGFLYLLTGVVLLVVGVSFVLVSSLVGVFYYGVVGFGLWSVLGVLVSLML